MGLARVPQMHVRVHEAGEQKAAIHPDLTGIGGKGPAEIGNRPVPHEQIERFVFQPLRRIGYSRSADQPLWHSGRLPSTF